MVTARMDDKSRILIPASVREELGLKSGDVVFLDVKDSVLRIAKAENPFDSLVEEAVDEHAAGKMVSIRDFAQNEGVDLE